MTHYYDKDGKKYPSVTTIISDCTNKSGPLTQWAANQVVEWIRQNTNIIGTGGNDTARIVMDKDLDSARFHFKDVSQTALDVGSEVHGAIEAFLKREIARGDDSEPHWDITDPIYAKLSKQAMQAFNAFNAWHKEHNLKPIALEQTVYGNCWAGTLDFLGYFDDKLFVIDWKSSKAHYKEMDYQVAAYRSVTPQQTQHFVPKEGGNTIKISRTVEGCGVLRLDKETGLPEWKDTSKSYESDLAVFNAMLNLYMLRHPRIRKGAGWKNT